MENKSKFDFSDEVELNFRRAGRIKNAKIIKISHTKNKTFYDLEVRIAEDVVTRIYNIEEIFLEPKGVQELIEQLKNSGIPYFSSPEFLAHISEYENEISEEIMSDGKFKNDLFAERISVRKMKEIIKRLERKPFTGGAVKIGRLDLSDYLEESKGK